MHSESIEPPSPDLCVNKIFEISGTRIEPGIALDVWRRYRIING